jgi:tRNA(Arg) A34 adenosine deaminase TadA
MGAVGVEALARLRLMRLWEGVAVLWERLSDHWRECAGQAWDAYCAGSLPIGAVVTGPGGRLLAAARNRRSDLTAPGRQIANHPLAHAELNALLELDMNGEGVGDYTLYTTTEPCPFCLSAVYMTGLRQVSYAARDPFAGSAHLPVSLPYFRADPIVVNGPETPELEDLFVALHAEHLLRRYPWAAGRHLQAWATTTRPGVILGYHLFASGLLDHLRCRQAPVATVFDAVWHECRRVRAEGAGT